MPEEEKKILVDMEKPGAEEALLKPPPTEIESWLAEEVDVFDMAAAMLKEEGTKAIFGINAGGAWNIETHSIHAGIPRVHVRTEQTATYAADAYGRMLQRPGVAYTGPATGIDYAAAGITQAYSAQSPVVYIAGESGAWDDDKYMLQGVTRTENVMQGKSKWARRCPNPATFLFQLKRAFRESVSPVTGPCCVAYTYEYLNRNWSIGPRGLFLVHYTPGTWAPKPHRSVADPEDVKRMMEWLIAAERPAIVAGEGIMYDQAVPELQEFTALTGIPTHCRRNSRGAISEYDPLNCYGRARGVIMRECDRSLLLGLRCGGLEWFGYPPFFGTQAVYAQAQTHPYNTTVSLPTEYELIGNIKLTLREMINVAKEMGIKEPLEKWKDWRKRINDVKAEYDRRVLARTEPMRGKEPIHPDLMGREISEFLRDELKGEFISIIDGWTAATYYSDWIKVHTLGDDGLYPCILDASDTITFGHGPGMALGAWMAIKDIPSMKDKPIIAIIGDGSIGSTGMDIETCTRWGVPAVFIHMNNNQIAGGEETFGKDFVWKATGTRLDGTFTLEWLRYDKMMAEFGIHTEFANRDNQIKPALKRSFDYVRTQGRPAFLEIHVDEEVMQEVWPTICCTMFAGSIPWDQLGEHAQMIMKDWSKIVSGLSRTWARKDWHDALGWPYQRFSSFI